MKESLKYPIGVYIQPLKITDDLIEDWIHVLEVLPARISDVVIDLSEEQLNTPYRPNGWTVRQLVHHLADSHHHSYTRFKWALTENSPLIKPYDEKEWSEIFDAKSAPIQLSLDYLKVLHAKLVYLLKGLSASDLKKTYLHPDHPDHPVSVAENIAKYAWHGSHHLAHIQALIHRKGW